MTTYIIFLSSIILYCRLLGELMSNRGVTKVGMDMKNKIIALRERDVIVGKSFTEIDMNVCAARSR
jgi:hypothetical protein